MRAQGADAIIAFTVETTVLVSPWSLLAPSAILASAALLAGLSLRLRFLMSGLLRIVAAIAVAVALLLLRRSGEAYAPLALFRVGDLTAPIADLRLTTVAWSWERLLLVGGLAVILSAPAEDLPSCLVVLAAACFSLLTSSLSSIALAWFITEAALFISAASGRRASAALGLAAGSTAALASLYASATSAGIGISQASLSPLTWLLALGAVALRLRLWPLSWPSASGPLRALWFLVGVVTGFAVLGRLAPALRPGELPQWATLVLLLSASGAGVSAWLTRGDRGRSLGWAAAALVGLLLAGEAESPLPPPSAGLAAAGLAAVILYLYLVPPLPSRVTTWLGSPSWLRTATLLVPAALLLPWPFLPFGKALVQVFALLAAVRPAAAALAVLTAGLATGSLFALSRDASPAPSLLWQDFISPTVIAILLVSLALGLGASSRYAELMGREQTLAGLRIASSFSSGALLAWFSIALAAALALVQHRRWLGSGKFGGTASLGGRLASIGRGFIAVMDTGFALIEGEASLTWATLVGIAILAIAAGL